MPKSYSEDTIAALATPPGIGAISIIRISGPDSINVVNNIFSKRDLMNFSPNTIHYGSIIDLNGEIVDDVLVSLFHEPNSYSGEDSVEISTHGNPIIIEKVIGLLIESGRVRLAEPGEFTKRAFLNNKIDLTQAEAVLDIISSRSEAALRGARNQLNGLLASYVRSLRDSLVNVSSLIELELDFSEEDVEFINREELKNKLHLIIKDLDKLINSYSFGKIIREGINVAIIGEPNVGKSSILNLLLKESRAIVSHIPGTTRDIIREEIVIDGVLFKLVDTAGIRTSENEIEEEGINRSYKMLKEADIILFISDAVLGVSEKLSKELKQNVPRERIIIVLNKIDLKDYPDQPDIFKTSALTGQGMEELIKELKQRALKTENFSEQSGIISNVRHLNCLKRTKENLEAAIKSIDDHYPGEFISVDLRRGESSLSEIIGEITSEDILNNIFKNFCIGK